MKGCREGKRGLIRSSIVKWLRTQTLEPNSLGLNLSLISGKLLNLSVSVFS